MTKESEDKKEQRVREGAQAWADYQAEVRAVREKTQRLRALRLAREGSTDKLTDAKKKRSRTGLAAVRDCAIRQMWQVSQL
jgi:hypothetical protein